MATTLLTRYILAPIWARLLIFITFYFIVRSVFFFDIDNSLAECMKTSNDTSQLPKGSSLPVVSEQKEEIKEPSSLTSAAEELRQLRIRDFELKEEIQKMQEITDFLIKKEASMRVNSTVWLSDLQNWFKMFNIERSLEELKSMPGAGRAYPPGPGITGTDTRYNIRLSEVITNNSQTILALKNQIHTNLTRIYDLEIQTNREAISNLRNSFDKKHDLANNEILDLKNQNIELQRTVTQQVAESKSQQELIENVRKSFERKLNARDLMINELKEEKTQLVRNITDLQQAQAKIVQDFALMKEHFTALKHQNDTLMHFQQLSMQRTNVEMTADTKTFMSPSRTFPELK